MDDSFAAWRARYDKVQIWTEATPIEGNKVVVGWYREGRFAATYRVGTRVPVDEYASAGVADMIQDALRRILASPIKRETFRTAELVETTMLMPMDLLAEADS